MNYVVSEKNEKIAYSKKAKQQEKTMKKIKMLNKEVSLFEARKAKQRGELLTENQAAKIRKADQALKRRHEKKNK